MTPPLLDPDESALTDSPAGPRSPRAAGLPPVFRRSEAIRAGLPAQRLRRADIRRVGPAIYQDTGHPLLCWAAVDLPEPPHGMPGEVLHALLRRRADAVLSHATAAHLHGLPTPSAPPQVLAPIDLTVPAGSSRVRLPGVVARRRPLKAGDMTMVQGLRVTSLERTVLDLASLPHPWTIPDVVAAADHAVHEPWSPSGRRPPATTPERLHAALRLAGPFHGARTARTVLARTRVGADSARETFLRLALEDAGLPEPALQARPRPAESECPEVDLYLAGPDLALQYDGRTHLTPAQQARDARRDAWLLARGCRTLRVNDVDHRDGYRRIVRLVRGML